MSETLYMRISTQNIACSERERQRERERERERERDVISSYLSSVFLH